MPKYLLVDLWNLWLIAMSKGSKLQDKGISTNHLRARPAVPTALLESPVQAEYFVVPCLLTVNTPLVVEDQPLHGSPSTKCMAHCQASELAHAAMPALVQ